MGSKSELSSLMTLMPGARSAVLEADWWRGAARLELERKGLRWMLEDGEKAEVNDLVLAKETRRGTRDSFMFMLYLYSSGAGGKKYVNYN